MVYKRQSPDYKREEMGATDLQLTQCSITHITPAGYCVLTMCESNGERSIKNLKIE